LNVARAPPQTALPQNYKWAAVLKRTNIVLVKKIAIKDKYCKW
jgi:hypothetical protein